MTQTELRKKISQTVNTKWFNSVEFNLNYSHLNLDYQFKGFAHLYQFVNRQIRGWEKLGENLPRELSASKNHFWSIKNQLVDFINSYGSIQENDSNLNYSFDGIKNQIQNNNQNIFTFDCPETDFLIEVFKNHPQSHAAAYNYIIGNFRGINNLDEFNGYILAYEFRLKDSTAITERRNKEKLSLDRLRTRFQNSLPKLESELVEHLKRADEKCTEYANAIDALKDDKEKSFNEWFYDANRDFKTFNAESNKRMKELETTYRDKLKLEEPAKYWSRRSKELKKHGNLTLFIMIGLILIVVTSLGLLLWITPEQIYESFFEGDKSGAIRWSIIYITIISFMAFAIRAVNKVMFSSFHLARDCEERFTLTYFYLSLLKDSAVGKEEKKLIMQALFSRAETGLLKNDSSPAMPNEIIEKVPGG